jgi:hypothetical protein
MPVTISSGAASQLVITTEPTTSVDVGKSIGNIAVAVEDAYGNIVTGDDSTVTLSGASSLTGTTTAAVSNGVATFTNLLINSPGTFTLTASDGTLTPADTDPITVAIGNVVIAGHTIKPIAINTQTAFGQSTAKLLTLSVQSQADGAVVLKKKFHVKNGKATISNLKLHQAGNYTLVIADAQGQTTTQQLTVVSAAANRLVFATQPTSGNGNLAVSVDVLDKYGNICANANGTLVTLHLRPYPALGADTELTGTVTAEIVNGIATFPDVSVHHTGKARLWATAKGLEDARSSIFTNV